MPEHTLSKSYKFKNSQFHCALQCYPCQGVTKSGNQCKRRTCIGTHYCFQHRRLNRVKVQNTSVGKGLFAFNPDGGTAFRDGDYITDYDGEPITKQQWESRYIAGQEAPYLLVRGDYIEDGACRRGIGTLINDFRNITRRSNAQFRWNKSKNKPSVYATRTIKHGEQILLNYGKAFRF